MSYLAFEQHPPEHQQPFLVPEAAVPMSAFIQHPVFSNGPLIAAAPSAALVSGASHPPPSKNNTVATSASSSPSSPYTLLFAANPQTPSSSPSSGRELNNQLQQKDQQPAKEELCALEVDLVVSSLQVHPSSSSSSSSSGSSSECTPSFVPHDQLHQNFHNLHHHRDGAQQDFVLLDSSPVTYSNVRPTSSDLQPPSTLFAAGLALATACVVQSAPQHQMHQVYPSHHQQQVHPLESEHVHSNGSSVQSSPSGSPSPSASPPTFSVVPYDESLPMSGMLTTSSDAGTLHMGIIPTDFQHHQHPMDASFMQPLLPVTACAACKRSHIKCDHGRPCQNCLKNPSKATTCQDAIPKPRGRPKGGNKAAREALAQAQSQVPVQTQAQALQQQLHQQVLHHHHHHHHHHLDAQAIAQQHQVLIRSQIPGGQPVSPPSTTEGGAVVPGTSSSVVLSNFGLELPVSGLDDGSVIAHVENGRIDSRGRPRYGHPHYLQPNAAREEIVIPGGEGDLRLQHEQQGREIGNLDPLLPSSAFHASWNQQYHQAPHHYHYNMRLQQQQQQGVDQHLHQQNDLQHTMAGAQPMSRQSSLPSTIPTTPVAFPSFTPPGGAEWRGPGGMGPGAAAIGHNWMQQVQYPPTLMSQQGGAMLVQQQQQQQAMLSTTSVTRHHHHPYQRRRAQSQTTPSIQNQFQHPTASSSKRSQPITSRAKRDFVMAASAAPYGNGLSTMPYGRPPAAPTAAIAPMAIGRRMSVPAIGSNGVMVHHQPWTRWSTTALEPIPSEQHQMQQPVVLTQISASPSPVSSLSSSVSSPTTFSPATPIGVTAISASSTTGPMPLPSSSNASAVLDMSLSQEVNTTSFITSTGKQIPTSISS